MYKSKYFNAGHIVTSQKVNDLLVENKEFAWEINLSLRRFLTKDWGDLSAEDKQVNEETLQYPDDLYLLGAYQTCRGKIWIITNRISGKPVDNATTILFPDER